MIVYNHDVAGLYRRINRFISELMHSVSGGTSNVRTADKERLSSYLSAIRAYHDWVIGQPELDLPETHPRQIELEIAPDPSKVENESVRDLITMLEIARDETVNGQSARDAAGMNKFDSARLIAVIEKCEAFLKDYIDTTTPLDLPESSPMREITAPGKKGA